ncbi:MAG: diguanylate cyclase [Gemmatimonadales bacterium]
MRFEINEKCVACLACVRACPSQAIAVDGEVVKIVDEACIRAGACVPACPHDAIDAIGDLERAIELARGGEAVLVLSVESEVHFDPYAPEQVVNACYEAGFRTVHRGVLGDELVAQEYAELLADSSWGTMIRSTCPVVVEQIRNGYPGLVPYLAPVTTPLAAEAAYIRAELGDVPLVYAGVCISEGNGVVNATVTFEELELLLERRGVTIGSQERYFERIPEVRQRHLSTSGGLPLSVLQGEPQASRRFRKVRGLGSLDVLARAILVDKVDLGFVDLLPCEGCLDHPLLGPREELYRRRTVAAQAEPRRSELPVVNPDVVVPVSATFEAAANGSNPKPLEIATVIERIGTAPGGAHWDCGACGYSRCVDFARAHLNGRATLRQCPPHQERRASEAAEQAATDGLTGLSTYRVLKGRLAQEIWRSQRNGEPFGVLFIDLDRFKLVNDIHGHEAGNRLLQAVAREITKVVRKTDVAARYGGDEFVLILVGTDIGGLRHVGELIRERVEKVGRSLGYTKEAVTASIGAVTFSPQEDVDPQEALDRADRALYVAKTRGGNFVALVTAEGDDVTVME